MDFLSADIRGILDDLQLDLPTGVRDGQAGRSGVRRRRAECSPSKPRPESLDSAPRRRRHYDSDTVRRYMVKQQEDRKRKQVQERRSIREEQERRSQRLQDLYKRQKEGVVKQQATPLEPQPRPMKPRLEETYTKMLLQHTLQRVHTLSHTLQRVHTHTHTHCNRYTHTHTL